MKNRFVFALLGLYGRASRSGLFDRPRARRAFEALYLAYKRIEAGPVAPLRDAVPVGSTVIDVGANIGFFTLRFARWVGPPGRVIAIEPEARNVAALKRRIAGAHLERVVQIEQAVAADKPGELLLSVNELHPGDHHIGEEGVVTPAVTIDDLVAGDGRVVSLIKIDVQGAEQLVLTGARRTIETHKPAIFIELDDESLQRQGASAQALVDMLGELGYSGHLLSRRGIGAVENAAALVERARDGYIDVLFLSSQ